MHKRFSVFVILLLLAVVCALAVRDQQLDPRLKGAFQNKVIDAAMAERMSLTAAMGHACGIQFRSVEHLRRHPEFAWQREYLRNLSSQPWTLFAKFNVFAN